MFLKLVINQVFKLEFMKGYRSYFFAGAAGLSVTLFVLGLIDETTKNTLLSMFGTGFAISVRAAIK